MRSALLCVFFTLIILIEGINSQDDDFRPMPIPLEWHHDRRGGRAGTLHETFRTESPPTVAVIPAHYWEDALRHSVYLTLVRDKIDQLIAKGDFISPNSKAGSYDSKEIDDHDLWDKIKTAPFDRIQDEDPGPFGDVTIVAKGRLLENEEGFRFTEDDRSKEKCSDDNCMRGVKAFWSVKRVRQRDHETSPGKYHYELTFSVISQMPKKQKKPHENPTRTFTVKESSPYGVPDRPQVHRKFGNGPAQPARPERAIWFHKNIAPTKQTGRKFYFQGLDRIFSSFFSGDEEKTHDGPQQKYKQNHFVTQAAPIYSKLGHVGGSNEQYQQIPFAYRSHSAKYGRPPLQAPPINSVQHQYLDAGFIATSNNKPYVPHPYDHRLESSQVVKTTRPAVLPTPLPHRSQSSEMTNMMSSENIYNTSTVPDYTKMYIPHNKYKATPVKVSYFTDHVRPPIYSAPPGVFVTMDKKPFKPMPPLKLTQSSKPQRASKPIDFKPSIQIPDVQSTDSFSDSAFRPITINFSDSNTTEIMEVIETIKKIENKLRKPSAGKKPTKKTNIKSQRTTTPTPDIITAQSSSEEEIDTMDWANLLGAFTKTTPMVSQTEKIQISETTTPMTTTTTSTTIKTRPTTTTEAEPKSTVSTTVKPIKRTRPPPKFVKEDQIKKHKRITTTTTSTTTTTTTKTPETTIKKRPSYDLTFQASSTAANVTKSTKSHRESNKQQTSTTSTTTTTTTRPTTTKIITTTTPSLSTTTTNKSIISGTTQPKSKNRFRQSTLMTKGTSVKHDRWNGIQKNQTVTAPSLALYTYRRKGSNFHGYESSTTPRQIDEEKQKAKESHMDRKIYTDSNTVRTISQTNPYYDVTVERYETNSVLPLGRRDEDYEDESKDHSEFIFQPTSPTQSPLQVISTSYAPANNKTKCRKKNPNALTTQESNDISSETFGTTTKAYATVTSILTPTEEPTTNEILQEFLNFNVKDDNDKDTSLTSRADLQREESVNHETYLKIDDFEDFLDIHLADSERKHSDQIADDDQYSSNDEDDLDDNNDDDDEYDSGKISIDDDTEFQTEDDKEESEGHSSSDSAKEKRPYSLLELMAMS